MARTNSSEGPSRPRTEMRFTWRHAFGTGLLCYGLWIANGALGLFTIAELRAALLWLAAVLHWDRFVITAIDEFALVVLGLGWLGWVLVTESLYRAARNRSVAALLRTVVRTTIPLLIVLAASFGVALLG